LRTHISVAVIALLALTGSIGGAAAQYYPPQPPPAYYPSDPPPPPPYPPQQTYTSTPLPPPGAEPPSGEGSPGPYYGPPDVPGSGRAEAYPPPPPPYFAARDPYAPQPLAGPGGVQGLRPPADVSGAGPAPGVTGTVPGPPGAAPGAANPTVIAALPPEDQPEQGPPKALPPQFRRQLVAYPTTQPAGTIIIDTPDTYLFLVLGHGKALRYGIGVGREGFTWTGTERISRMKEWPDWFPPKEMIERQPYLPRFMAGGESNPLGARALYLGNTLYRIHGTNQPSTIGTFVSSGCIRLTNDDIADLYSRVNVGTRVVVLPGTPPATASAQDPGSH
jgi:lipoprotein-anchoring transpeptidase ErfK/SrfK